MIVDPRDKSGKLPHDWREAWSAFTSLKKIASAIGESTASWQLETSGRLRRTWYIRYSFRGHDMRAYAGRTGKETASTLKEIYKGFQSVYEGERTYRQQANKKTEKPNKPSPIYDLVMIQKMKEKLDWSNRNLRTNADVADFWGKEKFLKWFMTRKAGVLNMSMQDYIYKHPHAEMWPAPPRTEQQLQNRQREFEKIVNDRERRKQHDGS